MAGKGKSIAVIAAILAMAGTSFAQDPSVTRGEFEALKARLAALEAENTDLKADLQARDEEDLDARLDQQLATMMANYQQGAVSTARSKSASVSGELRSRGTYGFGELANQEEISGGYTAALARLVFAFQVSDDVQAQIVADSVYVFGGGSDGDQSTDPSGGSFISRGQSPNRTQLNLHEAWFTVNNVFGVEGLSSKTGRQEVHVGRGLMIGSSDWFDGYTHDGTILTYADPGGQWALSFVAMAQNTQDQEFAQANSALFNEHDFDGVYALYFSYLGANGGAGNVQFDAYVIHVSADANSISLPYYGAFTGMGAGIPFNGAPASHTTFGALVYGTIAVGDGDGVNYSVEGAYQTGDDISPTLDIEGYIIEVDLRFKLQAGDQVFDVFTRFLYASGPDDGETGFVPLFPDRHSNYSDSRNYGARYGMADLMPLANVISFQLGLIYALDQNITLGITGIYSEADEAQAAGDDAYGFELDFWGRWQQSENLTYTAGVALVFPDDQGEALWGLSDEIQAILFFQARLLF